MAAGDGHDAMTYGAVECIGLLAALGGDRIVAIIGVRNGLEFGWRRGWRKHGGSVEREGQNSPLLRPIVNTVLLIKRAEGSSAGVVARQDRHVLPAGHAIADRRRNDGRSRVV